MPSSSPPRTIADQQLGRFGVLFAAWFFTPGRQDRAKRGGLAADLEPDRMTVSGDLL
jgi:hypothetical protein